MQNTTDSITLDYEQGSPCPYCGEMRPMQMRTVMIFKRTRPVPVGYLPCQCEGAKVAREEAERKAEEEKRKMAEVKRAIILEKAGIPPRYRHAEHRYAEKMAGLVKQGQGFFIHGSNGTGKTTLAMAVGIILAETDSNVLAVSTYDLMEAMRSRKDEDHTLFAHASTCDVLILDDLGKEASNTAYACERLFAIIDKRDKAMLPTIITSNYLLSQIAAKITEGAVGEAIASRLAGSCKQVPLDGEDWRLKNV